MRPFIDLYWKIVVRLIQVCGFCTINSDLYLVCMHTKWIKYKKHIYNHGISETYCWNMELDIKQINVLGLVLFPTN